MNVTPLATHGVILLEPQVLRTRPRFFFGSFAIRVQNLSKCYSVCSWLVYNFLHPKPVDFGQDPLALGTTQSGRKSFDANQAISTILFERSGRRIHDVYPTLKKLQQHRLAFFAYPLSGGFKRPSFISTWMMRPVLTIEHVLRCLESIESIPSLSHPRRVGAGISLR